MGRFGKDDQLSEKLRTEIEKLRIPTFSYFFLQFSYFPTVSISRNWDAAEAGEFEEAERSQFPRVTPTLSLKLRSISVFETEETENWILHTLRGRLPLIPCPGTSYHGTCKSDARMAIWSLETEKSRN